ncbi:MAG TPA: DUF4149 domain-containing protein [Steroidobacteraceae bacterium]|nr:DUF4149 domain-containing protein [Steroidobacteraceae bacterium]
MSRLFRVVFVLWAGSLWSLAAWIALTLFHAQPDRHLAGMLAARLFSIETYVGLAAAGLALLGARRRRFGRGFAAAGLLAADEWLVKPAMTQAQAHGKALGLGFGPWHGVAAAIYLTACLLVLWLVWSEDLK